MFGDLKLGPTREIAGLLRVGNYSIVPTCDAILFGGLRAYEPIANIKCGIGAKAIKAPRCGQCCPIRPVLFERGQNILPGKVAKPAEAVLAGAVLKVKKLSATLTLEKFHRKTCVTTSSARKRGSEAIIFVRRKSAGNAPDTQLRGLPRARRRWTIARRVHPRILIGFVEALFAKPGARLHPSDAHARWQQCWPDIVRSPSPHRM